jgi:hypothetical protein
MRLSRSEYCSRYTWLIDSSDTHLQFTPILRRIDETTEMVLRTRLVVGAVVLFLAIGAQCVTSHYHDARIRREMQAKAQALKDEIDRRFPAGTRRSDFDPFAASWTRWHATSGNDHYLSLLAISAVLVLEEPPIDVNEVGYDNDRPFRTLGPKGLTVIGLSDDWGRRKAEPVISCFRLTWPNADPESIRVMLSDNWQVASVPLFVVLDADRRILRISRTDDTSLRGTHLRKTLGRMLRASHRNRESQTSIASR